MSDFDPYADATIEFDPYAVAPDEGKPPPPADVDADGFGDPPSPEERPDLYSPSGVADFMDQPVTDGAHGTINAFGTGAMQGLTLGHSDEAQGALGAASSDSEYSDVRDRARQDQELLAESSPVAYGLGEITGALAPLVMSGGAAGAPSVASGVGRIPGIGRIVGNLRAAGQSMRGAPAAIGQAVGEGLGYGALAGEGFSDADVGTRELADDTVVGGLAGAATGGLGEAVYRASRPLAMGLGALGIGGAALDVIGGTAGLGTALGAGAAALGLRQGRKPGVEAAGRAIQGAGRSVLPERLPDVIPPLLPPEQMPASAEGDIDWESLAPLAGGAAAAMMLPPPTPQALAMSGPIPQSPVPDVDRIQREGADIVRQWEEEEARAAQHLEDYQSGLSPEDASALRDLEEQRARVAADPSARRARARTPGGIVAGTPSVVLEDLDGAIDRIRARARPASGRRPRRGKDLASMFLMGAAGTELGQRFLPEWLGGADGSRGSGIRPLSRVGPQYDHVSPQWIDPDEVPLGPEPDFQLPDVSDVDVEVGEAVVEPGYEIEIGEPEYELPPMDIELPASQTGFDDLPGFVPEEVGGPRGGVRGANPSRGMLDAAGLEDVPLDAWTPYRLAGRAVEGAGAAVSDAYDDLGRRFDEAGIQASGSPLWMPELLARGAGRAVEGAWDAAGDRLGEMGDYADVLGQILGGDPVRDPRVDVELGPATVEPRYDHVSPQWIDPSEVPLGPEPDFQLPPGSLAPTFQAEPTLIRPRSAIPQIEIGEAEYEYPPLDIVLPPERAQEAESRALSDLESAGRGFQLDFGEAQITPRSDLDVEVGEAEVAPAPARTQAGIEQALRTDPGALGQWAKPFANARARDPERGVQIQMEKLAQSDPAFRAWLAQDRESR